MQLHELKRKTKRRIPARVGRGGKRGKTSGRGGKGQTARAGNKRRPEWRDIIKKLPKRRGYGKNRARTINAERVKTKAQDVTLATLEKLFAAGSEVTAVALLDKKAVRRVNGRTPKVKVLSSGSLTKALTLKGITVSESARAAIEKAGGKVA